MRKHVLLLFVPLLTLTINAQQQLSYHYDAAGNRINRNIVPDTGSVHAVENPMDSIFHAPILEHALRDRKIRIYPNPVESTLTIEIPTYTSSQQGEYSLYNLAGIMLQKRRLAGSTSFVDMSIYAKGMYILHIQVEGELSAWKVIKK